MGRLVFLVLIVVILVFHSAYAVNVYKRDDCGGCEIVALFKDRSAPRSASDPAVGKIYMFRAGDAATFRENLTHAEVLELREQEVERIRDARLREIQASMFAAIAAVLLLALIARLAGRAFHPAVRERC